METGAKKKKWDFNVLGDLVVNVAVLAVFAGGGILLLVAIGQMIWG